ncbi:alpha-2-macroglobulin family protein [Gilvibacter sediminis]|uniref:alpha-2-macroglobulin family protein n=1 Tax=Gilvibacter sediminis TaxID=379071 RepID=UPI00234FF19A|nr:MG2 domain-containing protein [Gilvibacter sediminis]MDC7996971.1 MG2 domain-containing protein [Gilvibacter sediminis]
MKSLFRASLILLLLATACKPKSSQDDQLFQYRDYLSYHTQGVRSVHAPVVLDFLRALPNFDAEADLSASSFKISPKVEGTLKLQSGRSLVFSPNEPLKADTEYTVTVKLSDFLEDLPADKRQFTFSFKTIKPNFKIDLGQLQSYDKNYQFLQGNLQSADGLYLSEARKLISAIQNGSKLSIKWDSLSGANNFYSFVIDSINRAEEDSQIAISWDGKPIGADNSNVTSFTIPGRNNFTVLDVSISQAPSTRMSINFSDPIDEDQDFRGLVSLGGDENLRFEADGNSLLIYPATRPEGSMNLTVFAGLKNTDGYELKSSYTEAVSFDPLKPEVRLLSKGTILPNAQNNPIYFETVNLAQVDVRVVEIFQDNVLQFLQESLLSNSEDYYLRRVGRRVAKKTLSLVDTNLRATNSWKAHALDLTELFQASPGSLYRVEFSFKPQYSMFACEAVLAGEEAEYEDEYYEEYYDDSPKDGSLDNAEEDALETRYWDNEIYRWRNYTYNWQERENPCHPAYYNDERLVRTNLLASDLGITVKKGNNSTYHVFTNNLISSRPTGNVQVGLYNYQQQVIAQRTTDGQGKIVFDTDEKAAFVVAQNGSNYAYARVDDGMALSLSKFDVSGGSVQKGLKGFLYTERGVHRPGDSIHLTFVLNDAVNPLPEDHPVKLELTDARGKLVERRVVRGSVNGFYYFPIATSAEAPTGNWNATVKVGGASFGKTLRVATIKPNRLKVQLDFDDTVLEATKPIAGRLQSSWLHGAPARNLKATLELTLAEASAPFKDYSNYRFNDPVRSFDTSQFSFMEGDLNSEGQLDFSETIQLNDKAPGMLKASFVTKVYEGGGDFSIDVINKSLAPYTNFVGLKSPKLGRYGSFETGRDHEFEVVTVDAQGKPAANRKLTVEVFEISWRWWWNRGRDNLSRYENSSVYRPKQQFEVITAANGKGTFNLQIADEERGRYLIRVMDEASGHATGITSYFFKDWWQTGQAGSESAKMLLFNADKDNYTVGEKARIQFPSSLGSTALISIENGTEVLNYEWVTTQEKSTTYEFEITAEMAPNVYVNISLLQPHERTKNDLPMRLYGVVPIMVNNPETELSPQLSMPQELKPESNYMVTVSETDGKAMTYTIAVVDEGLLDLTRFSTPDIHKAFYARQALGVKTFDIYDLVMGAFSTQVDNVFAVGGGDEAAGAKNRKADRFKPVVSYLGPFKLEAGQSATHTLTMPNYIGSVKTMVVAGDNATQAYGRAEQVTPVRTPLMVLASVPRKLSPGEKLTLPVTVFAMDPKVKQAEIRIETTDGLKPVGDAVKTVRFDKPGEQIVNFEYEIQASNEVQEIKVLAQSGAHKASYPLEIDIYNPNPISRTAKIYTVEPGAKQQINFTPFGTAGSNKVTLELSTIPPMNLEKRLDYLIRYPHGCVEQTTSGAFPQLYLKDLVSMSSTQARQTEENIKSAIRRLGRFQNGTGGLGYWMGESTSSDWGTSYAGHFMLEAKQQGYTLPVGFLSNWVRYQRLAAKQWRKAAHSYNTTHAQAYRLYTLALAGQPELAAMNRLRKSSGLTNAALWRLAGAYALTGNKKAALELLDRATLKFNDYTDSWYTYGSALRNMAMALEIMTLVQDSREREMAESIAARLSSRNWLSTQETSYSLLALGKMVKINGGKAFTVSLDQNGQSRSLSSEKSMLLEELSFVMGDNTISLNNPGGSRVYASLIQRGRYPMGAESSATKNLSLRTQFLDKDGNKLDISDLRQGTEFKIQINVVNSSIDHLRDLSLTQLIPSGWEIVNTSFTDAAQSNLNPARYTDIRDDRVNYYFDLRAGKSMTFEMTVNASYLGRYYLAGTHVATMYSDNYYARLKGQWINVKQ